MSTIPFVCTQVPCVDEAPVCTKKCYMGVIIQPVYKPLPKARLCVKCRGYVPSAHFVSALDSVCDRHEHSDAGLRYCTVCDDFVDMHKFYP